VALARFTTQAVCSPAAPGPCTPSLVASPAAARAAGTGLMPSLAACSRASWLTARPASRCVVSSGRGRASGLQVRQALGAVCFCWLRFTCVCVCVCARACMHYAWQAYYEAVNNGPVATVPLSSIVNATKCPFPSPPGGNASLPSWFHLAATGACSNRVDVRAFVHECTCSRAGAPAPCCIARAAKTLAATHSHPGVMADVAARVRLRRVLLQVQLCDRDLNQPR
jgi:hypothetical protein